MPASAADVSPSSSLWSRIRAPQTRLITMSCRIAVIAIDAVQPHMVADFWCSVLGWKIVEEDGDIVSIGPQDTSWPTIDILGVPESKTLKNRLHLDLRADVLSTADELERLLALGARRVEVGQDPEVSWVVLGDPEGNEFCLLSRSVDDMAQASGLHTP